MGRRGGRRRRRREERKEEGGGREAELREILMKTRGFTGPDRRDQESVWRGEEGRGDGGRRGIHGWMDGWIWGRTSSFSSTGSAGAGQSQ